MLGFRKKKKKKQSNKIRRSITVKSNVNNVKLVEVKTFLISYNQCVNYFIKKYWNRKDIVKDKFIDTHSVQSAKQHFPTLKSRVIQCAGKEALQNIRSQSEKSIRQRKIPRFKKLSATLDSRFWKFSKNPNSFEWIQFESGPTFGLPFKRNEKYWNKWSFKEFKLSKTIRVKIRDNNILIEFFFEKKKTQLKSEGETLGVDLGYRKILATSNNQIIGELKHDVENLDKRENNTHEMIENKILCELKKLDLTNIKTLVLEDLNMTPTGTSTPAPAAWTMTCMPRRWARPRACLPTRWPTMCGPSPRRGYAVRVAMGFLIRLMPGDTRISLGRRAYSASSATTAATKERSWRGSSGGRSHDPGL